MLTNAHSIGISHGAASRIYVPRQQNGYGNSCILDNREFRPSVEFQDMARSIFTGSYSKGERESGTTVRRTKGILLEPLPRPETPRENENAQAIAEREARNQLAWDKIFLENDERRARGPKVGHNVYYNEVQKRVASRLFLALGTEEKKKFVQKNPHVEVSKLEFREMVALAKIAFDKTQSVT